MSDEGQLEVQLTGTYVTSPLEDLVAGLAVGILDLTAVVRERFSAARQV